MRALSGVRMRNWAASQTGDLACSSTTETPAPENGPELGRQKPCPFRDRPRPFRTDAGPLSPNPVICLATCDRAGPGPGGRFGIAKRPSPCPGFRASMTGCAFGMHRTPSRPEEMEMTGETRYLNTRQAAAWLGLPAKMLARHRVTGNGPVFHRFGGRIRCRHDDLETRAASRRRIATFDDGTALAERAEPGDRNRLPPFAAPVAGTRGRSTSRRRRRGSGPQCAPVAALRLLRTVPFKAWRQQPRRHIRGAVCRLSRPAPRRATQFAKRTDLSKSGGLG